MLFHLVALFGKLILISCFPMEKNFIMISVGTETQVDQKLYAQTDESGIPVTSVRGFLIQRDNLPDRLASIWQRSSSPQALISLSPRVFRPLAKIFKAALWSRSNTVPQCPQ
jgi:hypothetical protein